MLKNIVNKHLQIILALMILVCSMIVYPTFAGEEVGISNVYLGGTNANDANMGDVPQNPVSTLPMALSKVAPNGTIWVQGSIYITSSLLVNAPGVTIKRSPDFHNTMFFVTNGTLTLNSITIDGNRENCPANTSFTQTMILVYNSSSFKGTLVINDGAILKNNDALLGGAITNSNVVEMNGGVIENCNARDAGGAIYMDDKEAVFTMKNGLIGDENKLKGNTTGVANPVDGRRPGQGGGICILKGTMNLEGGTIAGNSSSENGGGIYCVDRFNMSGGVIANNTAGNIIDDITKKTLFKNGGGISLGNFNSVYPNIDIKGGEIKSNTAQNGGGLYCGDGGFNGIVDISNGTFSENIAMKNGGGVMVNDTAANIIGPVKFIDNIANAEKSLESTMGRGNGIYNNNSNFKISGDFSPKDDIFLATSFTLISSFQTETILNLDFNVPTISSRGFVLGKGLNDVEVFVKNLSPVNPEYSIVALTDGVSMAIGTTPPIINNDDGKVLITGSTLTLTAKNNYTIQSNFKWQVLDNVVDAQWTDISDFTLRQNKLTLNDLTAADSGKKYRCIARVPRKTNGKQWEICSNEITLQLPPVTYKVTYHIDDLTDEKVFNEGDLITFPTEPEKEGYIFNGWWTDTVNGVEIKEGEKVNSHLQLYAKWVPCYTVSYANGENVVQKNIKYGEKLTLPIEPVYEGYYFVGWWSEIDGGYQATEGMEVTKDITFYARWQKMPPEIDPTNPNLDLLIITVDGGRMTPEFNKERLLYEVVLSSDSGKINDVNVKVKTENPNAIPTVTKTKNGGNTENVPSVNENGEFVIKGDWFESNTEHRIVIKVKAENKTSEKVYSILIKLGKVNVAITDGIGTGKPPFNTEAIGIYSSVDVKEDVLESDVRMELRISERNRNTLKQSTPNSKIVAADMDIMLYKIILPKETTAPPIEISIKKCLPIRIKLKIPTEHCGGSNYFAVRTHVENGISKETILYDLQKDDDYVTIETDCFSRFTIYYDPPVKVNVNFMVESGIYNSQSIIKGTKIVFPTPPIKNGFTFNGWWSAAVGGVNISDKMLVNEDITVFAHWRKNESSVGGGGGGGSSGNVNVETPKPMPKIHESYIIGYPEKTFMPQNTITRAEAVTILARISGEYVPRIKYSNEFTDVKDFMWHSNYVGFAFENNLIKGYDDGNFMPGNGLKRGEFSAMIARYLNLSSNNENNFTDVKGHWSEEYVGALVKEGIVDGYTDGSFKPESLITRAEAVKMINRALGRGETCKFDVSMPFNDVSKDFWAYNQILEATINHEEKR